MLGPAEILRLWHTVRHLRPVQVYGRLLHRFHPAPDLRPAPPLRERRGPWVRPAARRPSMVGPTRLHLLGATNDLDACGWDDPHIPLLWRYNQHYFDDLTAHGADSRTAWHRDLMQRWVLENPPGRGTGWAPYPVSLRIVNWSKWMLSGHELPESCRQSLAVQARWLTRRLERHLLGNHLFVNAKALIFAGCLHDGPEADAWLRTGAAILREQIPEQILPDGGQFERSPMYHALALEDMLDLQNLFRACGEAGRIGDLASMVQERIRPMRAFLRAMTHPDGEIAFFNDAAIGVHPSPSEIDAYAGRLGHPALPPEVDAVIALRDSGYVRVKVGEAVLIADVGRVGPDYLPGHAHADTLSFELSIGTDRVLVNSGTSEYGSGAERARQRGTAAHNAVTVEGQNSSEVWGGFRVARRAGVTGLEIGSSDGVFTLSCGHDGFGRLRRGQVHRRRWTLGRGSLEIEDTLTHPAAMSAHFHWAPGCRVEIQGSREQRMSGFRLPVLLSADAGKVRTEPSTWHPGFGDIRPNLRTVIEVDGTRLVTRFDWA